MARSGKLKGTLRRGLLLAMAAGTLGGCTAAGAAETSYITVAAAQPRQEGENAAVAAQLSGADTLPARFNPQSKWDWMDGSFELDITTEGAPREGVVFTADLLLRSDGKPQFQGRMNVETILLVGEGKRWAQCAMPAQLRASNFTEPVMRDGAAWYRARVAITFSGTVNTDVNGAWTNGVAFGQVVNQPVTGIKVFVAGTQCSYQGQVRLENASLGYTMGSGDGVSVSTTVPRHSQTALAAAGDVLTFESGARQALPQVKLADAKATAATVRTARYLAAMGSSDHVIFGHQDSVWSKAGTAASPLNGLSCSDIEDMTGSPAGVVGFDGLSLAGKEFSAALWNSSFAQQGLPSIDIAALGEPAANVKALAYLSNYCLSRGALVTLSCHMPNFSQAGVRAAYQAGKEPAYARYDFTTSTARDKGGNPMQGILPGGAYNAQFTAYLDMVADYASQVNGPILFRPFHEGTGSWFWWGTSTCDAATYQKVFRYTVEYLRDKRQVHNLLYVYSPDGNPGFFTEAQKRYPGDAYVDVIGYDNYQTDPSPDSSKWFADFSSGLSQLRKFAVQHGKVLAVTETGVNTSSPALGDVVTGLPRTGCADRQWFEKLLDAAASSGASYVLVWSNNSEMFHTPFVRAVNGDGSLYGHEMLDDFLRFYNDRRSVFALDQLDVVRGIQSGLK